MLFYFGFVHDRAFDLLLQALETLEDGLQKVIKHKRQEEFKNLGLSTYDVIKSTKLGSDAIDLARMSLLRVLELTLLTVLFSTLRLVLSGFRLRWNALSMRSTLLAFTTLRLMALRLGRRGVRL